MTLISIILQVALNLFSQQPNLAAGNLCAYFPQDTLVSEAPAGYKPFYISHIARHGSRFLSSGKSFNVIDELETYANAGELTAEGLALIQDLRTLREMSENNYGKLTALGAEEHRQICDRMMRHYPEVFENEQRREVDTYATNSDRVLKSRESFLAEMLKNSPEMKVSKNDSQGKREVTGDKISEEQRAKGKAEAKNFDHVKKEARKGLNFKAFDAKIFVNPGTVSSKTVREIERRCLYLMSTAVTNDLKEMNPMARYFAPEELYYFWVSANLKWAIYLNYPGYTYYVTDIIGRGILKRFVEDADAALAEDSHTAATLRFSHDSFLMPFMAATRLEGTVLDCEENQIPELFQDFNYICPACNVQFIFYRNAKGKVLVKFLLNEKETLIHGLKPEKGVFYDWAKVKKFYQM